MPITIAITHIRNGQYRAAVNGKTIVAASTQPFLDAARALLAQGHDPAHTITMVRAARPDVACLSSTIGAAAKLTVMGAYYARWKPPPQPNPQTTHASEQASPT